MTAFITRCLKSLLPRLLLGCWLTAVLGLGVAQAQTSVAGTEPPTLRLERSDDALWLSTQLKFDLSPAVVDALHKGIPIYLVAEANVSRERWYWTNKHLASVQRHLRLSYHPLTRRWRLNSNFSESNDSAQGLALNQNFESLADAMRTIRRISYWRIADIAAIDSDGKYAVEFNFQLDTTQLPRPLQIGTQGQSDWLISVRASQSLGAELRR